MQMVADGTKKVIEETMKEIDVVISKNTQKALPPKTQQ